MCDFCGDDGVFMLFVDSVVIIGCGIYILVLVFGDGVFVFIVVFIVVVGGVIFLCC